MNLDIDDDAQKKENEMQPATYLEIEEIEKSDTEDANEKMEIENKNEGATNSELRKTYTKEQIITEKIEEEEKEMVSDNDRPINKDLSSSFKESKNSGYRRYNKREIKH